MNKPHYRAPGIPDRSLAGEGSLIMGRSSSE